MFKRSKTMLLAAALALVLALCGCNGEEISLPAQIDLFPGDRYALAGAVEYTGGQPDAAALAALQGPDVELGFYLGG